MSTENKNREVISLSQAVNEVRDFVYYHDELQMGKLDDEDLVVERYPNIVNAIQIGLLVIDEKMNPIYTLKDAVGEDEVSVNVINFRTRIKPMENANITKNLDISKNQWEFLLRCISFLTQQPKGVINNLSKYDFKTIEQICTLFL